MTTPSTTIATSVPPVPVNNVYIDIQALKQHPLRLSYRNFFHLYVGHIDKRAVVLPIYLTIHPSIVHSDNLLASVIPELVTHLPILVQDTALQKAQKENRTKPRLWRTLDIEFNAQFRNTQPTYQIMTRTLRSKQTQSTNDSDSSSSDNDDDTVYSNGNSVYRGGDYRAFVVSAHSLHVRAIARNDPMK